MAQKSVVCFDIGIKNLAFCHLKQCEGNRYEILGWENVNLLAPENEVVTPTKICFGCKSKAVYEIGSCARHAPKPVLTDLSGNKILKFPSVAILREILLVKEPTTKKSAQKTDLLEALRKHYSLPLQDFAKKQKAANVDLSFLHDCMRKLVQKEAPTWSQATEICLENQPVFKNPQMKSVQMLLFATIRDILQPVPPPMRLVHAGNKVKGKKVGDDGYKERKKGAEDRVKDLLLKVDSSDKSKDYISMYNSAAKKNDLSDAFCMAVDALTK